MFAAAWARRPETGERRLIGPLPAPLTAAFSDDERVAWNTAIDYYDKKIADRDLRSGAGMTAIKRALAQEDLSVEGIGDELGAILQSAAPVYREHFWPQHDHTNRDWIKATAGLLRSIEQEIVPKHERLYGLPWFSSPVRVDVVWVGRAYTTLNPVTHATVSPAEGSGLTGWKAIEMVLHEVCHELILPTEDLLAKALGERVKDHGGMWHAVQFYMTGLALQEVLQKREIQYIPYLYSTGLFDRAWHQYRRCAAACSQLTNSRAADRASRSSVNFCAGRIRERDAVNNDRLPAKRKSGMKLLIQRRAGGGGTVSGFAMP